MINLEKNKYREVLVMEEKDNVIDDIDCIDVSLVEQAREIVARQPDIREDKIAEMCKKYSDPKFEPDAADIADGIIEELKILGEIKKNL